MPMYRSISANIDPAIRESTAILRAVTGHEKKAG